MQYELIGRQLEYSELDNFVSLVKKSGLVERSGQNFIVKRGTDTILASIIEDGSIVKEKGKNPSLEFYYMHLGFLNRDARLK